MRGDSSGGYGLSNKAGQPAVHIPVFRKYDMILPDFAIKIKFFYWANDRKPPLGWLGIGPLSFLRS